MLLPGLLLMGAGLLLLLFTQYNKKPLPEGIRRSRGIILQVSEGNSTQVVKGQYFAGRDSITFSTSLPSGSRFFAGQQVFVDYDPDKPAQPLQLLSVQEVLGRKFLQLIIAVLLIVAGVLLVRLS